MQVTNKCPQCNKETLHEHEITRSAITVTCLKCGRITCQVYDAFMGEEPFDPTRVKITKKDKKDETN